MMITLSLEQRQQRQATRLLQRFGGSSLLGGGMDLCNAKSLSNTRLQYSIVSLFLSFLDGRRAALSLLADRCRHALNRLERADSLLGESLITSFSEFLFFFLKRSTNRSIKDKLGWQLASCNLQKSRAIIS